MDKEKLKEIAKSCAKLVQTAENKSRTMMEMKTMWKRVKEVENLYEKEMCDWGAQEAIMMLQYIETVNNNAKMSTWATQKRLLSVLQKTLYDKGYAKWTKNGALHLLAKTSLNTKIKQEANTAISSQRITTKQMILPTKEEIKRVGVKLYLETKKDDAYTVLRNVTYIAWVIWKLPLNCA